MTAEDGIVRIARLTREAKALAGRPPGVPTRHFSRVGVIGAGMMGAGIGLAAAQAGLDVVLVDTSLALAEKGRDAAARVLERKVAAGAMEAGRHEAVLARLRPSDDMTALAGSDLVVEAVYEDRHVKESVLRRAESVVRQDAIIASNTSTLPISGLAGATAWPGRFIGLHFFSPVDRMPLVEVIVGRETATETVAGALDFVGRIGKVPIVVNDSRGFYTSRVFATYVTEGYAMLEEGIDLALIDEAGMLAGMPVGPLALSDTLSIELAWRVERQTRDDLGADYVETPIARVSEVMVARLGRLGRKTGAGFYDYGPDGTRKPWPGLADHFPPLAIQPPPEALIERLLAIQSVEALRCLGEGVVRTADDADLGAVLGWGFPAARGGPLGHVAREGTSAFLRTCERLASAHGQRFAPPPTLLAAATASR